ncbi:MAG: hypothetical protein II954_04155 [Synergistaceae bacterium]|nr:hypothetical protein [Synergistaceae bacterium]
MRKYLWLFLALFVFCAVSSGGCGGGSSNSGFSTPEQDIQSQDVMPNVPDTPTSTDSTPTTPTNPTPTTPNNPSTPDNTPTTPDNPATPNNPSAEFNMNGTWRIVSGEGHEDNITFPENSHTYYYIEGTAPTFDISVSKNSDNEYYAVKLSGEEVVEEKRGNFTVWLMPTGEYTIDNPRITSAGTFFLRSFNGFTHPEANYYVCDNVNIIANFLANRHEDFDFEHFEDLIYFRAVDNDTIIFHVSGHSISTYRPTGIGAETYEEVTMTLKRVQ